MAGMTKPPDPNTKVPRLKCPPSAIDAHLHLFGPNELYPTDANSVYETADALPETLIGMHRVLGTTVACWSAAAPMGAILGICSTR